jgi:hypothetical protein
VGPPGLEPGTDGRKGGVLIKLIDLPESITALLDAFDIQQLHAVVPASMVGDYWDTVAEIAVERAAVRKEFNQKRIEAVTPVGGPMRVGKRAD